MNTQTNGSNARSTRSRADTPVHRWIRAPVAALSFWSAVLVPVFYVPVFVAGLDSTEKLIVFLGLSTVHLLALIGGRGHNREPT